MWTLQQMTVGQNEAWTRIIPQITPLAFNIYVRIYYKHNDLTHVCYFEVSMGPESGLFAGCSALDLPRLPRCQLFAISCGGHTGGIRIPSHLCGGQKPFS